MKKNTAKSRLLTTATGISLAVACLIGPLAGYDASEAATAPNGVGSAGTSVQSPIEPEVGLVPELSTRTSNTYRNQDGSFTADISLDPVNFKDVDGEWAAIDNTFVDAPGGTFALQNTANSYKALIPADPSSDPVKFVSDQNWVKLKLAGLESDTPESDGAEATLNLSGNETVTYEATDTGLKENVVLDRMPKGPVVYKYKLQVSPGLTPSLDSAGNIIFTDATGDRPFFIPAGTMSDSKFPDPAFSTAVTYDIAADDDSYRLLMTPSYDWLSESTRIYPVSIDPTVDSTPPKDCYLREDAPSTNLCNQPMLWAGRTNSNPTRRRGLLDFNLNAVPADAGGITAAEVRLWHYNTQNLGNSGNIDLAFYQPGMDWSQAATWYNSGTGSGWDGGSPGGDRRSSITTVNTGVQGWNTWNVLDFVGAWVRGGLPRRGMLLRPTDDSTNKAVGFVGQAPRDGFKPNLQVTYYTYPSTQTPPSFPNLGLNSCSVQCNTEWFISNSATPTFSASSSDPDTATLTYQFSIRDYLSEQLIATGSVAGSQGANTTWTSPTLPEGGVYEFGVRVTDGTSTSENAWYTMSIAVPHAPDQAREMTVSPCLTDCATLTTDSSGPTLTAQVSDQDDSPIRPVFEVFNNADGLGTPLASGASVVTQASGTARYVVPTATLNQSGTYYFRVKTSDSTGTSVGPMTSFTVARNIINPPSPARLSPCVDTCATKVTPTTTPSFATTNVNGASADVYFEVRAGSFVVQGVVTNSPGKKPATWTVPANQLANGPAEVRMGVRLYSSGSPASETVWNAWTPFYIQAPVDGANMWPAESFAGWADDEPSGTVSGREAYVDEGPMAERADFSEDSMVQTRSAPEVGDTRSGSTDTALAMANAYSPVLRLDSEDRYGPLSATTFINNSKLVFNHICGSHTITNNPSASRLGTAAGYPHQARTTVGRCSPNHIGDPFHTTDRGAAPRVDGGPPTLEGYYLDLADDLRDGGHQGDPNFGGNEPFYYRYVPYRYVVYAFLYGDSAVATPGEELVSHEGDWEFAWVRLDKRTNAPKAVQYEIHGKSCLFSYGNAPRDGRHPLINVGNHSHANYPAGKSPRFDDDASGDGPVWRGGNLKNVDNEPWFGFTGAWGQIGSFTLTSGPEGIDPYKGQPLPSPEPC